MSRNSLVYFISFGLLSLLVAGCGGNEPKPSDSPAPTPSTSAAVPASPQPVVTASPAFSQTLVTAQAPDKDVKPMDIAAGLIPATDPEVATKAVPKGRTDPFAAVIARPVVRQVLPQPIVQPVASRSVAVSRSYSEPIVAQPRQISTVAKSSKISSKLGAASIAEMAKKLSNTSNKIALASTAKAISSAAKPASAVAPSAPVKTALLTPPSVSPAAEPELSKAIQVSGIAEINGQMQVIVKLPGESFSRYISVGERVLNGKVLIKRVQDRTALAPIVVLEEVGVEVYRRVGEKPLVAAKDAQVAPK